ncbi:hypothetical protein BDB00DRAFT_854606 [Zychaea mexicana]|uniref:uncharacterized protein n=1 Tax=Zychaea mexicana TaxID=64656 RepID=UPI0022FE873C|nr:uncharacterized protein BDB00DRAFT_854606 [Zychaea mexicana]KAI9484607.1 hypothetical protein BDB00DRAFT_854606 [Zychaea mexicana]
MLVHNPPSSQHTLRPRSAYTIYPANSRSSHMKLTFKKRFTQQLNRLLFPCNPETDRPISATTSSPLPPPSPSAKVTASSSLFTRHQPTTATIVTAIQEEQADRTDFFENDERAIVHELSRLPSLKPPPRPKKTKAEAARPLGSALSQSTLATVRSSHFDDISELLRDDSSDTSLEEDEDEDEEFDTPRPQVALSVAILPSAVAAATAARSRRYQARVARAAQR